MAVGVTFTLAMAGWGLCEGAQRDGGSVVYRYPGVMSGTLTPAAGARSLVVSVHAAAAFADRLRNEDCRPRSVVFH